MKLSLWKNRITDYFQQPLGYSLFLITSKGIPICLYPHEIMVCTPAFSVYRDFGLRGPNAIGYLAHGESTQKVNRPNLGQPIFIYSVDSYRSVDTGQTIKRIYPFNVHVSISSIRQILSALGKKLNVASLQILPDYPLHMYYNRFLALVLYKALSSNIEDWTLTAKDTKALYAYLKETLPQLDIYDLFHAGFLSETKDERLVINTSLKLLLIEAIHTAKPEQTTIDNDGSLSLVKK